MYKRIFFIVSLLITSILSYAQVSSMRLGYCDNQVATKGELGISGENTIDAAIYLPQEALSVHNGNYIVSIKAGLASKLNITSLTVWVRDDLNGQNLAEATAESFKKGWNDITLNTPYTITGDKGLYIGYTFTQKGAAYGISTVGNYIENSCYVKLGNDASWETRTDLGALSIEAMIQGDNLPKYDVELRDATTKEFFPLSSALPVNVWVRNVASYTITGFDVVCTFDGLNEVYTQHIDCNLEYDAEELFTTEIYPSFTEPIENVKMTITIDNLAEGDDQIANNNTKELYINVIGKEFVRNILIEEFTTERCPNCPFGTRTLHSALDLLNDEYNGRLNTVCHHAGYFTDWLTVGASEDLLWLFNAGGSTYAPAFMSDRMGVWNNPGTAEDMAEIFRKRLDQPAYAEVQLEAEYNNEEGILTVTATGERSRIFCENAPRIGVYVVENNINAKNQGGHSGTDPYIHQHVLRNYNAAYGEEIVWNEDNTFEYICTLDIKANWKTEDMEIIAFICDYNNSDATQCVVENSTKLKFDEFYDVQGIKNIANSDISIYTLNNNIIVDGCYDNVEVFTISGVKVGTENLPAGVYIVNVYTGDGNKTHKIII